MLIAGNSLVTFGREGFVEVARLVLDWFGAP